MRTLTLTAAMAALSIAFTSQAFALNPQPEPPNIPKIASLRAGQVNPAYRNRLRLIGSATSGAGAGRASDADDNYCGTRVPGHLPHGVGPMGGISTGGRVADYDDGYCGTKVPGHLGGPHYGATIILHANAGARVMLNPQPLPPGAKAGRAHYGE